MLSAVSSDVFFWSFYLITCVTRALSVVMDLLMSFFSPAHELLFPLANSSIIITAHSSQQTQLSLRPWGSSAADLWHSASKAAANLTYFTWTHNILRERNRVTHKRKNIGTIYWCNDVTGGTNQSPNLYGKLIQKNRLFGMNRIFCFTSQDLWGSESLWICDSMSWDSNQMFESHTLVRLPGSAFYYLFMTDLGLFLRKGAG